MFNLTFPKIPKGVEIEKAEKCIIPVCCFKIAWIFIVCSFFFHPPSQSDLLFIFALRPAVLVKLLSQVAENHCHSFSFLMPGLWTRRPQPAPLILFFSLSPGGAQVQEGGRVFCAVHREVQPRRRRVWAEDERVLPGQLLPLCFSWLWPRPPDEYVIVILFVPHRKINQKKKPPPWQIPGAHLLVLSSTSKAIQLNSLPPHFHGYCRRFYGNPRLWRWQKQPWSITAQINL